MSRIKANIITNENANGAVDFPDGLTISGIVTSSVIKTSGNDFTISGNLGVGGVVTAENYKNEDSIGIITARSGVKIGESTGVGATIFTDGSFNIAGTTTAGKVSVASSVTAGALFGDGSNLTGVSMGVKQQHMGQNDGSTRSLSMGTFTFPNITSIHTGTDSGSYVLVPASQVTFKPPTGCIGVLYEYDFNSSWTSQGHGIQHYRFYINGSADGLSGNTEIIHARFSLGGTYFENLTPFSWYFRIRNDGGSFDTNTGAMPSWTENKTITLQSRAYNLGGHTISRHHGTFYWDGGGGNQFHQPRLKITCFN